MNNNFIKDMSVFKSEEEAIDYYFNYYKEHGYPNYDANDYNKEKELLKVIKSDNSKICDGNSKDLQQSMTGCGFLWTFFPHWIEVETANCKSVKESWENEENLKSLITKLVKWVPKHDNGRWSTNRVRQCAKVYCAKSSVSNFRPTVAKYLYDTYGNKGNVYDPCGGWGGRMLGFLASECKEYVCCEPSTKTYEGLCNLRDDYSYVGKKISVNCLGAEDFIPENNHFDLAFTSPPYFDTERYSNEDTQSWVKYPKYEDWLNGFLKGMISNCYSALKEKGYLIINIANTKTAPRLEEDTIKIALEKGFEQVDTLYLVLSSIAGKGIKREPVFVFKKN